MSVVIDGEAVALPNIKSLSWLDDPKLRLSFPNDGTKRQGRPQCIILHTTTGDMPQHLVDDAAPPEHCTARRTVAYWAKSPRRAGAHLIIDADGTLLCLADLGREVAYHCSGVNGVSVGIEVVQQADGTLYAEQLRVAFVVCEWLCDRFNIPRQVAWPYTGARPLDTMRHFRGVAGHRDVSSNRGRGDPGDLIMLCFVDAAWPTVG